MYYLFDKIKSYIILNYMDTLLAFIAESIAIIVSYPLFSVSKVYFHVLDY